MPLEHTNSGPMTLPDYHETVAYDMISFCDCRNGVWLDLGGGAGELGLAVLAKVPDAIFGPARR
jgi:hypothetical protein